MIHDIVKKYAKSKTLNNIFENNKKFKLVLVNNLNNLSFYAQAALRRTMERYNDKCRFIMRCNSLSKVIDPLQSRCRCIRVPAPSDKCIFECIYRVACREHMNLSLGEYTDIIKNSYGNVRQALWELQFKKFGYSLTTSYINSSSQLVTLILKADLRKYASIRNNFYNTMITNFTSVTILRDLINKLYDCSDISDETKQLIVKKGAEIDYALTKGRREIIHFDSFVMNCMHFIKQEKLKKNEKINIT